MPIARLTNFAECFLFVLATRMRATLMRPVVCIGTFYYGFATKTITLTIMWLNLFTVVVTKLQASKYREGTSNGS